MPQPQTAPYGSWASPITSDMIVASSIGLGEIMLDGSDVYWLEARPQEGGRSVLVRRAADGTTADVTPPVAAGGRPVFNLRTRVHEYGGGAFLIDTGTVWFCNDADQRLHRQPPGAAPVAITPDPEVPRGLRYADGAIDARRRRMVWVCEDHGTGAAQPLNSLVEVSLDGSSAPRVPAIGARFLCCAAALPGRDAARLGRMGPPVDALGRLRIMGGGDRGRWIARRQAAGRRRSGRVDLSARMVARRRPLFRLRPCPGRGRRPVVEPLSGSGRCASRRVADRAGMAARRRVRPAAMEFPHARPLPLPRRGCSSALISRTAFTAWRRSSSPRCNGARSPQPIRTSRRFAPTRAVFISAAAAPSEPTAIVGSTSPPAPPRCCAARRPRTPQPIAAICRRRSRSLSTPMTAPGPRPVLPAAQSGFCRTRRRIAAADRALPRRPDRRRLGEH